MQQNTKLADKIQGKSFDAERPVIQPHNEIQSFTQNQVSFSHLKLYIVYLTMLLQIWFQSSEHSDTRNLDSYVQCERTYKNI